MAAGGERCVKRRGLGCEGLISQLMCGVELVGRHGVSNTFALKERSVCILVAVRGNKALTAQEKVKCYGVSLAGPAPAPEKLVDTTVG